MVKDRVDAKVSTGVGIDTVGAVKSINQLENAVKGATNEWKQMESQQKRAGDTLGASEAKYKGLSSAVEKQENVLKELKEQQSKVNTENAEGQKIYQQYESQITSAERKLTTMTGQLEKAHRAYQLEQSGINSLNRELQQHNREVDAHVERLRAEGKETEANEYKRKGLATTIEKQTKLYEAQVSEMKRLESTGEASADSISKQKIALDKVASGLAKSKAEYADFGKAQSAIGKNNGADVAGTKMERFTGKISKTKAGLVAMGATAGVVLAGVAKAVDKVFDSQNEVNTLQAKTTLGYGKSKDSILAINRLYAHGYGESMEDLQETYAKIAQLNPHKSVKELAEDTKLVSTYAKLSGADAEEVMQGADRATKNWHISYKDYFDQMTMLQKRGDDVGGDLSDNMAEYSQVMGQMGFSAKETASIIDNGIKAGAYDADKVMDYVKEFNNSLSDGRLEQNIGSMSKKSQEMFAGYKAGKVPMKDLFNQITGDIGTMKDKQEAATLASNIWGGLGEDNALKVVGGLGKTNKAFDDVKGTADKTSKQLKESNPFELLKRGAEASASSMTMNATQTKDFNKALKPLQKAVSELLKNITANMPAMIKAITPVIEFVSKNMKLIISVIGTLLAMGVTAKVISSASKITGAIGSVGKAVIGTAGFFKKHADSFNIKGKASFVADKAKSAMSKLHSFAVATGGKIKKVLKWSASIASSAFKKGMSALKTLAVKSGSGIKKALKFTANIATKGANLAMAGLVKTAKATGRGIKLAFNFMKANPFILIISAITAVVVSLTTLYKHNKKFRNFVNGLVKSASDFAKGVLKWFGKAWSNISSFFKKVINFVKKDWKEILLYIVNPFAGAFALIYKHNAKFRKAINNLVKTVVNYFKNMGKNISHIFTEIHRFISKTLTSISKTWNKAWKNVSDFFNKVWTAIKKSLSNVLNTMKKALVSSLNAYIKLWSTAWKNISKVFSNIWNGIKKFLRSMLSWVKNAINDSLSFISKIWHKGWNKISSFFSNTWRSMKRVGHDAIWSLKNTFDSVLGKIHKAFSSTWKGIKSGFSDMWDGMKTLAGKGINAVIKIPNAGISGINGLIHDFGGPKHAISKIPKVKFATGTGMFSNVRKAITKPTLALLNDGNDSPETGNQETLIHPNGAMELVQGRNTKRLLAPGTEVLNASETAMMLGMQAMPFKSGTGFWSGLFDKVTNVAGNAWSGLKNGVKKFTEMFKFITNAVAHPVKTLQDKFNPSAKGLAGMFDSFGTAMFKKPKEQAKDWWKTLWSMANDASNAGADGGMKGDDYKYKNRAPDSNPPDEWGYFIKECVSFVASRLANSGVSASKFSHLGNGSDWVNAPVPHMSKPKVGSVAVYSAGSEFGNHVAMVTGVQGNKISGEEYNWLGQHKYHQYHNRNASGATTFLDFGLRDNSKPADVKANSALEKLIKKQTGGMLGWIQKFIAPLNDTESGGVGGDVQSWSGDVKKALAKLGLSTAPSMVQRVLRQINTESGGNPKAVQGYIPGDPNNAPQNRARGLMQVIPSTFRANALSGHKDIFNGYDNILAGLNYARKRYGDSLSWLGHGQGYEHGGLVSNHGFYEIAEKNKPEMIIPLADDKVRANQLLDEASLRINGKKNSDDSLIEKLLAKQDVGDTYEINININADVTPNAIKKIQQAVEDAITRKQNARTRAFG